MKITGIGIDEDIPYPGGDLSCLDNSLARLQACGFDNVELTVHQLVTVIKGKLRPRHVEDIKRITEKYPFIYTVHAPLRLNLAFPQTWPGYSGDLEVEKDVFAASLEFCASLGAGMMVYHSGLISLHQAVFYSAPLPGDEELEQAYHREIEALRELTPLAAEYGVVVGMENRDPHPWEAAVLAKAGLPPEKLLKYHAGMNMDVLASQVEAVNHPNFGITLDFGHLYIAARYCGFDYLEALRRAAPHIRHLHVHDNFGRLGGVFETLIERMPYGDGDVHLPPGWGEIPYSEALPVLSDYEGLFVLEINPHVRDALDESLETARALILEAEK